MIDYHGGRTGFINAAQKRSEAQFNNLSNEVEDIRRKLRVKIFSGHHNRYIKASKDLLSHNYRFPTDLLSGYGATMLLQKIDNSVSNDIPTLMKEEFHLHVDDALVLNFHNAREIRNKIAHGEDVSLQISRVTEYSKVFKSLAIAIDQHLLNHYFISEKYI